MTKMADMKYFYVKLTLICLVLAKPENTESDDKQYYNPDYGEGCANPPKLENGRVAKIENSRHARVVWFKCNDGYKLGAADFRVCMKGRMWSNSGSITCTKIKVEVQQKLKNLGKDVKEIEETQTGKLITAGAVLVLILILLLMVHIGRVVATRKSMQTKYDDVIQAGDRPRQEVPSLITVSNDLLRSCLCCRESKLPKKFTPKKEKKEKKKKKKSKEKDHDDKRYNMDESDINMNRSIENSRPCRKKTRFHLRDPKSTYSGRLLKGQPTIHSSHYLERI